MHHASLALADTAGVPGRMERVDAGQPFTVIVDYAHTADSLRKVLEMLRPLAAGRLIAVFGSAGERDPTKRAPMGRVAAELADLVVVTDEDPRLEDPRAINEEIADGARAGRRAGTARRCGSSTTGARRSGTPSAWLARATSSCWPARATRRASSTAPSQRPWDEAGAAREALAAPDGARR